MFDAIDINRAVTGAWGSLSYKETELNKARIDFMNRFQYTAYYRPEAKINGVAQEVILIDQGLDLKEKMVFALPGESLLIGDEVDCTVGRWLITSIDEDNQVTASGEVKKCNHFIQWKQDDITYQSWCVVASPSTGNNQKDGKVLDVLTTSVLVHIKYSAIVAKIEVGRRFMFNQGGIEPEVYEVVDIKSLENTRRKDDGSVYGYVTLVLQRALYSKTTDDTTTNISNENVLIPAVSAEGWI